MRSCGTVVAGGASYNVKVEEGSVDCATARRVMASFLASDVSPGGWRCFTTPQAYWAAGCGTAKVVVKAYGPIRNGLVRLAVAHFSLRYPAAWYVESAEAGQNRPGGRLHSQIADLADRRTLVRADLRLSAPGPVPGGTPRQYLARAAAPLVAATSRRPGYRLLGLERTSFEGNPALRWRFLVGAVHVDETFFTDQGANLWTLTLQAPATRYTALSPLLATVRRSFRIG